MSGRCATCKHWFRYFGNIGSCQKTATSNGEPHDTSTLARAEDVSALGASLVTKPDFGCVMWEAT